MKSSRAYLTAPRTFEIRQDEITPGPDEVLVKIEACGLCNWELNHWKGLLGTCPQTLGHEWGGVIVELGRDVKGHKVGDRVTGLAAGLEGFAELGVFGADHCYPINGNVRPGHALAEPLKCVVTVLRAAAPEAGDAGVVLGCGAMGLWCIQVLRGNLVQKLIAIEIDDTKLALAREFGATRAVNPSREDAQAVIAELTGGRMADFAIEATGRPAQLEQAIHLVRKGRGRVILMSSHEGAAPSFDFRPAIERSVEIKVAHPSYSLNETDDLRRAVDLLNAGVFKLDRVVTHSFPLSEIEKGFQHLEQKPAGFIKGIIVP
jgi:L-iditol 2-dehydrogenase